MRALVLSGGGSKGAFQAGALRYLQEEGKEWYKAFCGVSVGALNCAAVSQFDQSQPAIEYITKMWEELKDSDVKKGWCFGYLEGLWKVGLYNTKPLRELVNKVFNPNKVMRMGNILRVGAVNVQTHEYRVFTERDMLTLGGTPVLASSAFPLMFEPIDINGQLWTDGGVRTITPLKAAIDIPEVTEVDIVLASGISEKVPAGKKPKNVVELIKPILEATLDEIFLNDVKIAKLYNKLSKLESSNKRFVKIRIVQPEEPLVGDSLTFDHDTIMKRMQMGYDAAKKQLK